LLASCHILLHLLTVSGDEMHLVKVVRGAASFALGQFAEHLQPEINEYYERVLPCIFTILSDPVPEVQVDRFFFYFSVQSPSCCWRFSAHHNSNGQNGVAKGFHWLGSIMKSSMNFFAGKGFLFTCSIL
jgi:hypothetical protein